MRGGVAISFVTAALMLLAAPDAHADADAAQRHFVAGKRLRDAGDCAGAIVEFEKSIAAESSIGGHYNLGYCHEQLANRQKAYASYKHAQHLASLRKDGRLREISGALASLLEAPHVRLVLPHPLPDGLRIEVDERLVPEEYYATETVVFTTDADTHTVRVHAPGYEARHEIVATKEVKAIELRRSPQERARTRPSSAVEPASAPASSGWTWRHWTGAGSVVVGVGLVTASGASFISYAVREPSLLSRYEQADACEKSPGSSQCASAEAEAERASRRRQYNDHERSVRDRAPLMIGALIGGAVMIGGGLVLYFTAPKQPATSTRESRPRFTPFVGMGSGGLTLTGDF